MARIEQCQLEARTTSHDQYLKLRTIKLTDCRDCRFHGTKAIFADALPPGQGRGYLWRLNTYWRFEEKDGGVYMQCEALSLTRDIPLGLGWLLKPLVTKIPRESLNRVLRQTRTVMLEKNKAASLRE